MNVPEYSTKRLSFGPGVLYLGAAGATPSQDIGAVKTGAVLTITRDKLEVKQGSPAQLIQQWVISESVKLEVHGMEWNLENLKYAIGAGIIKTVTGGKTLELGGTMSIEECALEFVHQMPAGGTVIVDIWKAQAGGEIAITFGDDPHEFPYVFMGLNATTDWAGNPLESGARLCKITLLGDFT